MLLMNTPAERPLVWLGETPLACVARREETHDTASFEFVAKAAGAEDRQFDYLPGQFISVGVEIDGKIHWRAYSISSSPTQSESLSITVKRVRGGLVSNWLLDTLQPGMSLPAHKPAGDFALKPDHLPPTIALFSAGCGITPMMSMARWLLQTGQGVDIHFFHSARSEDEFIFGNELQALAEKHPQLKLHLFLSQPQGRMQCHAGRLDASRLKSLFPQSGRTRAYLCGQEGYMNCVSTWLKECGMAEGDILSENFAPFANPIALDADRFNLSVPAFERSLEIAFGEKLLDALEREGLPIIGACRTGVCGSCKCKVVSGEVDVSSTLPLSADEISAGYVLACCATAKEHLALELG